MTISLRDHVRTLDTNREGYVVAISERHAMARVQFVNTVEDEWVSIELLEQVDAHVDERYAGLRDLLPKLARSSWVSHLPARCA